MRKQLIYVLLAAVLVAGDPKNNPTPSFRVVIVEGDGALNSLPSRIAREPVVRVDDSNGKPLSGARVEFAVPKSGPSLTFSGGSAHFSTTTDSDGVAKASGIHNNGIPGGFTVLVHVSYQGQTVADKLVHQTNVASPGAHLAGRPRAQQDYPDASMASAVLGIAMGDQFYINGTVTPTNTNLAPGNRVQTKDSPVTIYIHDHCEFLVGPHSSVIIQPHLLSVMGGAVRAKHFGDCKFGYGGLWVTSPAPDGDAVVALTDDHMEVGSVNGPVEVANALKVVNTVQPGSVTAFNFGSAATGATISSGPSTKMAFMLGVGAGASLLGLGLAIDAIAQPSSSHPTSP